MKARISLLLLALPAFTVSAVEDETQKLRRIFEEEWEHTMDLSPTWASQRGDRRWNDRWPDLSLAAIEREYTRDAQMLERLATSLREGEGDRILPRERAEIRAWTNGCAAKRSDVIITVPLLLA
jgi:hypothetical protein